MLLDSNPGVGDKRLGSHSWQPSISAYNEFYFQNIELYKEYQVAFTTRLNTIEFEKAWQTYNECNKKQ